MHKENLEQAVTTTGRRGEIYLKMDMGGGCKKKCEGKKTSF